MLGSLSVPVSNTFIQLPYSALFPNKCIPYLNRLPVIGWQRLTWDSGRDVGDGPWLAALDTSDVATGAFPCYQGKMKNLDNSTTVWSVHVI